MSIAETTPIEWLHSSLEFLNQMSICKTSEARCFIFRKQSILFVWALPEKLELEIDPVLQRTNINKWRTCNRESYQRRSYQRRNQSAEGFLVLSRTDELSEFSRSLSEHPTTHQDGIG